MLTKHPSVAPAVAAEAEADTVVAAVVAMAGAVVVEIIAEEEDIVSFTSCPSLNLLTTLGGSGGGGYENRGGGGETAFSPFLGIRLLTTKTIIKVVEANTILEVVNLTVVVAEATTTSRVVVAAVAAGKHHQRVPRTHFFKHRYSPTRRTDSFADILTNDSGQERMGGKSSVAVMAFGS